MKTDYRIRVELPIDEVNWPVVLSILMSRFRMSFPQADRLSKSFCKSLLKPLSTKWFKARNVTADENKVVCAICEAHGADVLMLSEEREMRLASLAIGYRQRIIFTPQFRPPHSSSDFGRAIPEIELNLLGAKLRLASLVEVLLTQTALALIATIFFALIAGCLLYGAAVAILFVFHPAALTLAATRSAPLGLALICMLVGVAGIAGRAIHNLTGLAFKHWRAR